jgi:hypothetical protein
MAAGIEACLADPLAQGSDVAEEQANEVGPVSLLVGCIYVTALHDLHRQTTLHSLTPSSAPGSLGLGPVVQGLEGQKGLLYLQERI